MIDLKLNSSADLRKEGKSFYWASFFLPKRYKKNAGTLYSICRYFDDIADKYSEDQTIYLKNKIVKELSQTIMPDLEKSITDVFWMNPKDFKNDYNSMHGAGFSIAPIFTQSAWFRYHNKDKKIKNLYFSAAGSHPGAGIPGVLSSAKVVENIIKTELK